MKLMIKIGGEVFEVCELDAYDLTRGADRQLLCEDIRAEADRILKYESVAKEEAREDGNEASRDR